MKRTGLLRVVAAGFVVAASVAVVISPVSGQDTADDSAVRIVARKLENGKIEFGLREQLADGSAGELLLPARRLFPTTATVGRWLVSSPQPLDVDGTDETLRIAARRHADGRVEFGLQHQQLDNSWSSTMLPTQRFFPADARVGRWLRSSPVTITTTTPTTPTAPVEDQVVALDRDFQIQSGILSMRMGDCFFDVQTQECKYIIDGWDAARIIQGIKAWIGEDCNTDLESGFVCGNWTNDFFDQRISEVACPENWYFWRADNLCHSIPPPG